MSSGMKSSPRLPWSPATTTRPARRRRLHEAPGHGRGPEDRLGGGQDGFDAHDHSGSGKGAPLGKDSGGSDIRSFSAGAVTTAKLASSAVTGAKTASGAITEAKIADETMTSAKLGDCLETTLEVPASSTATWNHGLGRNPISYAGGSVGSEAIALAGRSDSSITFGNATASPHTITIWYR